MYFSIDPVASCKLKTREERRGGGGKKAIAF
jgi:hypothetical protein